MRQKYKVFTEQGGILICDSRKNNIVQQGPTSFSDFAQFSALTGNTIIHISAENPKQKIDELFAHFQFRIAAGGLLIHNQELLMIHRNGFWDLPKGHVDMDEAIEEAALREVREECGVSTSVQLVDFFRPTYHAYLYNSESVLKRTDWFIMSCPSREKLTPQIEEGISECKWVPFREIDVYLEQAFISIRELIIEFMKVNPIDT